MWHRSAVNTPQYEGCKRFMRSYKDKGFEILAFPCNDFGGQEPGTNEENTKLLQDKLQRYVSAV